MFASGLVSAGGEAAHAEGPRQPPSRRRDDLHQAPRVGDGTDARFEGRLLRDECGHHVRIQVVGIRVLPDQIPVDQREDHLAHLDGQGMSVRCQ